MWLSNSSVGRKVVMSVTGIALVLITKHVGAGYHRYLRFGPSPL